MDIQINKIFFYILVKKKEKITAKNDKIKKEQEIEVNSVLSKIKTYNGNFSFNSEKLETKPIMKKLVNLNKLS